MEHLKDTPIGQKILKQTYLHTGAYAKYFYPGRFNLAFDTQLDQIFNVIDAKIRMPNGQVVPKYNKINIISWRGRGKTTIAKTIVAKKLRHNEAKLVVYVGKNHDWAATQTENIKRGMLQNPREKELFGPIKAGTLDKAMQEMFSKKAWVTSAGSLVTPRGCGQPVRGLIHDWGDFSYRVELVVIDDLMDKKFINSEVYREDTWDWLLTDISEAMPAPELSLNWQIVMIDTVKHSDAVNVRLDDPDNNITDWKNLVLPLGRVENGHLRSNAPSFYTDEQLYRKYLQFRNRHKLDLFYQEYMCVATAKEDAVFKPEMFKYYDETSEQFRKEVTAGEIENVVLVDFAKNAKMSSDWTAIVGVGVNTTRNKIYVRDIEAGHFHPVQAYDKIFTMAKRLRPCHVIGLETHSLHEFILHPFMDEMTSRGEFYEIVELNPRKMPAEAADRTHGKEGRVSALASYYRKGAVLHNQAACQPLEAQLLGFTRPKRWDVMDAFAYIVQILEKGMRYFETNSDENEYVDERAYDREVAKEMAEIDSMGDDYLDPGEFKRLVG